MNIQMIPIACVILALIINLAVEVEKKVFPKFPVNILTVITSTVSTILAFVAYITASGIHCTFAYVVAGIAACVVEAYIAMFGYDKFIQTVKQYKEYTQEKIDDKIEK